MNLITNGYDIKKILQEKSDIIIYGIGEYGKRCFDFLNSNGIKVTAFIDNHSNETYRDVKMFAPKEMFEKVGGGALYIITSMPHWQFMYDDCVDNGIPEENIFSYFPAYAFWYDIDRLKSIISNIDSRSFYRITPQPIINFETHLVHHCNLKCKGCDQFSPLADEWYADIKAYKKDMRRMSEIFDGEAGRIWLIGGEPLLHPCIVEFMKTARENFTKANIRIFTNGLLLCDMSDEFWECCRDLDIELLVTQYPVNYDYGAMKEKAGSHCVSFTYANNMTADKTLWKFPLDLNGGCDPRNSFLNCSQANKCITLSEGGDMYTCAVAAHIDIFNRHFGLNIGESKRDYINIYQQSNPREILRFFSEPIPTCRYCNVSKRAFNLEWEVSRKELSEWTN